MQNRLVLLTCALLFFWGMLVSAGAYSEEAKPLETSAKTLDQKEEKEITTDLSQLIQKAFEQNPAILEAKAKWVQTIQKYPQQTSLDDPIFNFTYFIENVETRVGPQNFSVGISQKFPFPGTLKQKGRVVEKEIEISRLQYEKTVRDVIADLKKAVYEYHYIENAIDITRQNQDLLKEILSFSQTQYTDQATGLNDVLRAESQLAQLDYDLITLRELKAVQASVINAILNEPVDTRYGSIPSPLPEETEFQLPLLDDLALEQNQEIRLSQLGIEKADESIRLAKKLNLPTFSLGANYIETGQAQNPALSDSGKDPIVLGGGISIPLWFGKNKARIRFAEEGKSAATQQKSTTSNRIKVELRKTFFQFQNAHRLVVLYRDHLIPQAKHSMQIAEEWNRNRSGSVSEILEVESVWLNFNLAWLRAQTDYAQGWVQLERLVGGSLKTVVKQENDQ